MEIHVTLTTFSRQNNEKEEQFRTTFSTKFGLYYHTYSLLLVHKTPASVTVKTQIESILILSI